MRDGPRRSRLHCGLVLDRPVRGMRTSQVSVEIGFLTLTPGRPVSSPVMCERIEPAVTSANYPAN